MLPLGDRGEHTARSAVRSSADAVLGSLMACAVSGPAAPEASESPTLGGTQLGFAAARTPAGSNPRQLSPLVDNTFSSREACLETELAAARLEIAALRAAADARESLVGVTRRSDLLVLQELETEELRENLAKSTGCAADLTMRSFPTQIASAPKSGQCIALPCLDGRHCRAASTSSQHRVGCSPRPTDYMQAHRSQA